MKPTYGKWIPAAALVAAGATLAFASSAPPAARADACSEKKGAAHQQCESFSHSAPGDEYFGRLKLSFLGINNTFFDERIRAGEFTTDSNIISHVDQAADALQDWARKYPDDPQLSRSYFLAARVYKKIYTEPAQRKSLAYMYLLVKKYPHTFFGKTAKGELDKGYTLHWFNQSVPCGAVTPAPLATPTAPPGGPDIEILQAACYTPQPAASP